MACAGREIVGWACCDEEALDRAWYTLGEILGGGRGGGAFIGTALLCDEGTAACVGCGGRTSVGKYVMWLHVDGDGEAERGEA